MFHESVPGVPSCPLAMGVPLAYVLHGVSTMKPMPVEFNLVEHHVTAAGYKDLKENEIGGMVENLFRAEAINTWRSKEYEKNVFSKYLPCSVLYEDPEVTKSFVKGKHCCFTFTHQAWT